MKRNARDAAYDVLFSMEQKKAYSNLALDRALSLPLADERDASLIKKLTDGVLERKMTLDYQIKRHLLSPKIRIKPPVRTILRMGIYEILFCDGIPARASVNEYVQLAKKRGYSHASGLINAILRKTAESGLLLPPKCTAVFLSVFYSCPLQMLALLHKVYGKDTESFLAASLKKPKIYGRVNTLRTNMDTLCSVLAAEGIQITPSNVLPDAFYFTDSAAFMRTQAFASGLFHIQDLSSQLCCAALLPAEGQSVLDVCAAPGGKTFTIAETLANTGSVLSCDIYRHKIDLIQNGADRLGLTNVTAQLRDAATDETPLPMFDRILCDVPCSGLGVVRKKPEIKYHDFQQISDLPVLQKQILDRSASLLKRGGRLVYSTCTVTREENEDVVRDFLATHPDFVLADLAFSPIGERGAFGLRLSPQHDDCDAFFIAPLMRV